MMRLNEALDHAQQAVALDPLSPFARGLLGLVWVAARKYPLAVEECRRAVKLAPTLWWLRWFYGTALLMNGKFTQGLKEFQTAYKKGHQPFISSNLFKFLKGIRTVLRAGILQRPKANEAIIESQPLRHPMAEKTLPLCPHPCHQQTPFGHALQRVQFFDHSSYQMPRGSSFCG